MIFHFLYGLSSGSSGTHWRTHIFQDGYCTTNQSCSHLIQTPSIATGSLPAWAAMHRPHNRQGTQGSHWIRMDVEVYTYKTYKTYIYLYNNYIILYYIYIIIYPDIFDIYIYIYIYIYMYNDMWILYLHIHKYPQYIYIYDYSWYVAHLCLDVFYPKLHGSCHQNLDCGCTCWIYNEGGVIHTCGWLKWWFT